MFLVIGLGNPGAKYLLTRHNIGFMTVDRFLESSGSRPIWKEKFKGLMAQCKIDGQDVIFIKPQTFMNLSGECVQQFVDFYKVDHDHILVVHDELDIGFGAIKIQRNRGPGGHNGLKSINEKLGSQDYTRLKLGVGKPPDARWEISNWVLSHFSQEEAPHMADFLDTAGDAIESFILHGYQKTATSFTRGPAINALVEATVNTAQAATPKETLKTTSNDTLNEKLKGES